MVAEDAAAEVALAEQIKVLSNKRLLPPSLKVVKADAAEARAAEVDVAEDVVVEQVINKTTNKIKDLPPLLKVSQEVVAAEEAEAVDEVEVEVGTVADMD